ncbi:hypothetical protein E4U60_000144, partial [Claviceps pazoutovae]
MGPWMMDREVPTQVRKLSRIIIPEKRLRKKKSLIFWSCSPFSCQPTDLDGVASILTFTNNARNRFKPRSRYLQTDWDLRLPSVAKVLNSRYVKSVGFSPVEVLYGLSRASDVGLEVFLTQASRGWDDHFCRSLAWPLEMSLEGDSRVYWMGHVEERRSEVQCRGQLEAVGRRDRHEQRSSKPFAPGDMVMILAEGKPPKLRPRWCGRFRVKLRVGRASYQLANLDGSRIRGGFGLDFHEDALKLSEPRTGYLQTPWDELL